MADASASLKGGELPGSFSAALAALIKLVSLPVVIPVNAATAPALP
jgi:hypothetical protein